MGEKLKEVIAKLKEKPQTTKLKEKPQTKKLKREEKPDEQKKQQLLIAERINQLNNNGIFRFELLTMLNNIRESLEALTLKFVETDEDEE